MAGVLPPPAVGNEFAAEQRHCIADLDHQFAARRREIIGAAGEIGVAAGIIVRDGERQVDAAARDAQGLREAERGAVEMEEHTSELQSLMRISYAVFCLKNKKKNNIKSEE